MTLPAPTNAHPSKKYKPMRPPELTASGAEAERQAYRDRIDACESLLKRPERPVFAVRSEPTADYTCQQGKLLWFKLLASNSFFFFSLSHVSRSQGRPSRNLRVANAVSAPSRFTRALARCPGKVRWAGGQRSGFNHPRILTYETISFHFMVAVVPFPSPLCPPVFLISLSLPAGTTALGSTATRSVPRPALKSFLATLLVAECSRWTSSDRSFTWSALPFFHWFSMGRHTANIYCWLLSPSSPALLVLISIFFYLFFD